MQTSAITVVTLNVWGPNKWRERRHAVIDWIDEIQPDLVALQEVERSVRLNQAAWIAKRTGMTAVFGPARRTFGGQSGNAVLSRLPVLGSSCHRLTDAGTGNEPRAILTVAVDASGRRISFASTHLSWQFDEGPVREQQVRDIGDVVVAQPPDCPVILCGDFNATPDSAEVRFIKGLGFIDAFEVANPGERGDTWCNANPFAATSHEPDRRIDYIFVDSGRVRSADVVCNATRDGAWPSDHFGVAARLTV